MKNYYRYDQNNSGGFYYQSDYLDKVVFVEAKNVEQANRRMKELGFFDLSYCECCGQRFYRLFDDRNSVSPSEFEKFKEGDKRAVVYSMGKPKSELVGKDYKGFDR